MIFYSWDNLVFPSVRRTMAECEPYFGPKSLSLPSVLHICNYFRRHFLWLNLHPAQNYPHFDIKLKNNKKSPDTSASFPSPTASVKWNMILLRNLIIVLCKTFQWLLQKRCIIRLGIGEFPHLTSKKKKNKAYFFRGFWLVHLTPEITFYLKYNLLIFKHYRPANQIIECFSKKSINQILKMFFSTKNKTQALIGISVSFDLN